MKYFIFMVLIPITSGATAAAFGWGWFDGIHGIMLNVVICLTSVCINYITD